MKVETHAFKLPKAGWKGSPYTLEGYNFDLAYLDKFLRKIGKWFWEMTEVHWDEHVEWRKNGPRKSFEFSAQKRALSAGRKMAENWGFEDHPLFDVDWPTGSRKPPRSMNAKKFVKLLAWALGTHKPERNTGLLHLIRCVGGRRFEIADALWEMVDFDERSVWLLTKAEDLKPREWEKKFFSFTAANALLEWRVLSDPSDPRIFGLKKNGVSSLFKRASDKVGFRVSAHDFRRGLGKFMAENGVADRVGMAQMGLKSHRIYMDYTEGADTKFVLDDIWGDSDV